MSYNKNPIGVFDSGVGGISVLSELIAVMPNEDFLYFGDSQNAPYGTKSDSEVLTLSERCTERLISMNAKAIVIACNTATSIAVRLLREKYKNIPIIGIEPAIKPAVEFKNNSTILVMATPITLNREKFKKLTDNFSHNGTIISLPCPGIVELIEQGKTDGAELDILLNKLLSPYFDKKIDSIVLGCTHYPFIQASIKKIFPYEINIFDGGHGTALETKRKIEPLSNEPLHKGKITFMNSKNGDFEIKLCKELLKKYANS